MKKILALLMMMSLMAGCSGSGAGGTTSNVSPLPQGAAAYAPVMSGTNVLPLQVSSGYVNEPVVTVVVCNPGTASAGNTPANCVTINNVLLDTGSSGLRIFGSLLTSLNLTQVSAGAGQDLAKCTYYGDGTTHWGPVKTADVVLGGETVSNVNIQILDASYKTVPTVCKNPESSPSLAQYNGILGVGIRDQDCGSGCTTNAGSNLYFACSSAGSSCTGSTASLASQVRNPVAAMTSSSNTDHFDDSNGTLLILPSVPSTGAISASGYVVFGVGTRPNNTISNVTTFQTDSNGYFYTDFAGTSNITAFIDSGSNGLYFPGASQITTCSGGWFCPSSMMTLQATQKNLGKTVSKTVSFNIIDAQQVFVSNNQVYNDLGADTSSSIPSDFDWGLPFFFGRSIYTGIDGKSSSLNASGTRIWPYYAY